MAESCSTLASTTLLLSSSSPTSPQLFSLADCSKYSSAYSTTCCIISWSAFHSYHARRASSGCSCLPNGSCPAYTQYLELACVNSFRTASTAFLLPLISHELFLLGKPSFQKSAVFFNIVQKAFDPPPFYLNICPILQGVFFKRVFEH